MVLNNSSVSVFLILARISAIVMSFSVVLSPEVFKLYVSIKMVARSISLTSGNDSRKSMSVFLIRSAINVEHEPTNSICFETLVVNSFGSLW